MLSKDYILSNSFGPSDEVPSSDNPDRPRHVEPEVQFDPNKTLEQVSASLPPIMLKRLQDETKEVNLGRKRKASADDDLQTQDPDGSNSSEKETMLEDEVPCQQSQNEDLLGKIIV